MLTKLTVMVMALSLAACATCERHPYVCAAGAAIIVGSVTATVVANSRHASHGQSKAAELPPGALCVNWDWGYCK